MKILYPNLTSLRENERNLNWNQRVALAPPWVSLRVLTGSDSEIQVQLPSNVEIVRSRLPGKAGFLLMAAWEMLSARRRGIPIVMTDRSIVGVLAWLCRPIGRYRWTLDIWDAPHKELVTRYLVETGAVAMMRRRASMLKVSILRRVARAADLVLASVLPETLDDYGIPERKIRTFGNAIRLPPETAASGQPRPPTICFVGRRVPPDRGILRLVEAVVQLASEGVDADVAIAGEVSSELRAAIGVRDPAGRVRLLGEIPINAAHELMSASRVGVLPYDLNEDLAFIFPVKLHEYLAHGCVVVASDLPGVRAVVVDGREALLVPPGDLGALTAALRRALTDDRLASEIAAAGSRRVRGWDAQAKADDLYEAVAELLSSVSPRN